MDIRPSLQLFFMSFLFILGVGVGIILFEVRDQYFQKDTNVVSQNSSSDTNVLGSADIKNVPPSIANIPPSGVIVGQMYDFSFKIVDPDSSIDSIVYTYKSMPRFLFNDGGKLFGSPSKSDVGTHKVEVSISDGIDITDFEFFIVVYE